MNILPICPSHLSDVGTLAVYLLLVRGYLVGEFNMALTRSNSKVKVIREDSRSQKNVTKVVGGTSSEGLLVS